MKAKCKFVLIIKRKKYSVQLLIRKLWSKNVLEEKWYFLSCFKNLFLFDSRIDFCFIKDLVIMKMAYAYIQFLDHQTNDLLINSKQYINNIMNIIIPHTLFSCWLLLSISFCCHIFYVLYSSVFVLFFLKSEHFPLNYSSLPY